MICHRIQDFMLHYSQTYKEIPACLLMPTSHWAASPICSASSIVGLSLEAEFWKGLSTCYIIHTLMLLLSSLAFSSYPGFCKGISQSTTQVLLCTSLILKLFSSCFHLTHSEFPHFSFQLWFVFKGKTLCHLQKCWGKFWSNIYFLFTQPGKFRDQGQKIKSSVREQSTLWVKTTIQVPI